MSSSLSPSLCPEFPGQYFSFQDIFNWVGKDGEVPFVQFMPSLCTSVSPLVMRGGVGIEDF